MCTLTFTQNRPERHIYFNRDELLSRDRAHPPELRHSVNGSYIMPVDPPSGGSWMGIHQRGYFVCLVNNYPGDRIVIDPSLRSRGLLISNILETARIPDRKFLQDQVKQHRYAPFYLGIFTLAKSELFEFDGADIRVLNAGTGILSSSGFQHRRIRAIRQQLFSSVDRSNPAELEKFHRYQNKKHPEEGVLMLRDDASTVSISHIVIGREKLSISYAEAPEFTFSDAMELSVSRG